LRKARRVITGTPLPRRWHYRRVPRKWRYRLAPKPPGPPKPKGIPTLYARFRRLFWSWVPWAVAGIWAVWDDRNGLAIGMIAMAIVSYLMTPQEFPPRYGLDHEFGTYSVDFLASMAGATGVPFIEGNRVAILNNGDEFYPAMLDAIRRAERSVTIEAYIYWSGSIGMEFAQALADRSRAGVAVKILLDGVGSASIGPSILETLEAGGCQVAWYNPIRWYSLGRFNNRTHRKSLIIDGGIAFTGGAGIADKWLGNAQDRDHWRDIQIRVEGPGVVPLQTGFAQNWLNTTGELISGPRYYELPDRAGNVAVQTILSSPQTGSSSVRIMYYLSIVCARKFIWIANPYFIPDQPAIDVLVDAKKRGVDVKVMVAGTSNDTWIARHNSVRLYGPLLKGGIEIYEYNHTLLHQKTMVIDDAWATVGTTNFDNRSFAHNEENNVCFTNAALIAELKRLFREDLLKCEQVTLERWQHRPAWSKIQGLVASLLVEQA
jgi:cardiolipin synthase A/B